jgi:hypothetical protein
MVHSKTVLSDPYQIMTLTPRLVALSQKAMAGGKGQDDEEPTVCVCVCVCVCV